MERAGTGEEDPRRPNVLAPVDAAARAAAAWVSERAHVCRPHLSRGSALALARKWRARRCLGVGKGVRRVTPWEGETGKERLWGMEERDDLELGKADPPRTWGGKGRGGGGAQPEEPRNKSAPGRVSSLFWGCSGRAHTLQVGGRWFKVPPRHSQALNGPDPAAGFPPPSSRAPASA